MPSRGWRRADFAGCSASVTEIPDAEMAVPKGDGEHARPVASFRDRIGYRLPTEVEWEVACRAGTVTPRFFGYAPDLLPMYCCYIGNSQGQSWVVGRGLPNPAGLFDMLGNVSEWCLDAFAVRPQVDAGSTGVSPFTNCAVRGNDYASNVRMVRSANRRSDTARTPSYARGFRIAQTVRLPKSEP